MKRHPVKSSHVAAIGYEYKVPASAHAELINAASIGKHLRLIAEKYGRGTKLK